MHPTGLYIDKDFSHRRELSDFISSLDLDEIEHYRIYKNTRNSVYCFPIQGEEYLLKVSRQDPSYPLHRKISFYLRNFFKHYGRGGFFGAKKLLEAGIKTIQPVAYFKLRRAPFLYHSCLVYRKIISERSVKNILFSNSPKKEKEVAFSRMVEASREIFDVGLVHGDLATNNFLVCEHEDKEDYSLAVIDTDHISRNLFRGTLGEYLFLRSFKRMSLDEELTNKLLMLFFNKSDVTFERKVLEFWSWLDRRPLSRLRRQLVSYFSPKALEEPTNLTSGVALEPLQPSQATSPD